MPRIFFWLLSALLFAGILSFSACTGKQGPVISEAARQNIFTMNLGTEPPDLDPAKMNDLTSFTVIQPLLKGLTQFDQDMNASPAIAERWEISPDCMKYRFYLRPDAKWSDGQLVKAQDFLYAWQRALDPETGADYVFFLFEIKNARAYYEGQLTDFSQVGVRVANDQTLEVTLERPTPFFLDLMASPIALPLRQDVVEKHGDRFTEAGNFLSNGAYIMESWVHEEKIVLKPNPYFYGEKPKVAQVDMLMVNDANTSVVMYENGELDFIETTTSIPAFDVRRLQNSPETKTRILHRINYFGFNTEKPPMNDPRVRKAFALALDRSFYPKLMQSGQKPLASWITPGLVGYDPEAGYEYNPEEARRLLAEAGYPDGKGFPEVVLGYRTMYDIQKEAEIAQFLWQKNLGVKVRLENMEWKVFLSQLKQNPPHIYRLGWFVDYPDADSFMNVFISDSGNNHTGWQSPEYDRLVQEAVVTADPAKRQTLYVEAQRLLLEEAVAIVPIYASEKYFLVKPYVKGLEINGLNLINLDRLEIDLSAQP